MAMTFTVNLAAVNLLKNKQPYTSGEEAGFELTRSTWLPNQIMKNRKLKDGDTITASGTEAIYLYNNYTSGDYAVLTYVSGSAVV